MCPSVVCRYAQPTVAARTGASLPSSRGTSEWALISTVCITALHLCTIACPCVCLREHTTDASHVVKPDAFVRATRAAHLCVRLSYSRTCRERDQVGSPLALVLTVSRAQFPALNARGNVDNMRACQVLAVCRCRRGLFH